MKRLIKKYPLESAFCILSLIISGMFLAGVFWSVFFCQQDFDRTMTEMRRQELLRKAEDPAYSTEYKAKINRHGNPSVIIYEHDKPPYYVRDGKKCLL